LGSNAGASNRNLFENYGEGVVNRIWLIVAFVFISISAQAGMCEGIEDSVGFFDAQDLRKAIETSKTNHKKGGYLLIKMVSSGRAIFLHKVPVNVQHKDGYVAIGKLRDGTVICTLEKMLRCF
jgi:type II restriction/modification system DNA methylase subunit YeeA